MRTHLYNHLGGDWWAVDDIPRSTVLLRKSDCWTRFPDMFMNNVGQELVEYCDQLNTPLVALLDGLLDDYEHLCAVFSNNQDAMLFKLSWADK